MLLKSAQHVDEGQRKGGRGRLWGAAAAATSTVHWQSPATCPSASALYAPSLVVVIRRAYVKVAPVVVVVVVPPPCYLPPFVYLRLS